MDNNEAIDENNPYPDVAYKASWTTIDTEPVSPQLQQNRVSTSILESQISSQKSSKMSSGIPQNDESSFGRRNKFVSGAFYSKNESQDRYHNFLQQKYLSKPWVIEIGQLLFSKYLIVIKMLSKAENNKHVASYELRKSDIVESDKNISKFRYMIEQGTSFLLESIPGELKYDERYVEKLWKKSKSEPYQFLKAIVKGVIELQNLAIFHQDLQFRNTIKFEGIFKIIDFDFAFDVSGKYRYYANTLQLICRWLQNPQLQAILELMFFDQCISRVEKLLVDRFKLEPHFISKKHQILKKTEQILNNKYQKKIKADQMCKLLKKYSYFYHQVQIIFLVYKTFVDRIPDDELKKILAEAVSIDTSTLLNCNQGLEKLLVFFVEK